MLDLYLEGLVKEASAKKQLDSHLEGLVKQANEKAALDAAMEQMSVGELAKLAGFKLAEDTCSKCGSKMEKLGKMYKCGCGMMKGAQVQMTEEKPEEKPEAPPAKEPSEEEAPKEEAQEGDKEKDARAKCASEDPPAPAPMVKVGSALFQVGDAAGRLMAKAAAGPDMFTPVLDQEELEEAAQEAQAREDIPGRMRRSAITGGGLGALGGAALGVGGGLLAKRLGLPMAGSLPALAGLGAAGGAGGGYLGARLGKRYGAEEAAADKVYAMMRQRKALQAGAQHGFSAGAQQGYMAGAQRGYLAGMRAARQPMAKQGSRLEAAKELIRRLPAQHPVATGAGVGSVLGAGTGAAVAPEGQRMKGALVGAGLGAAGGAGVGALSDASRLAGQKELMQRMRVDPWATEYAMQGVPLGARLKTIGALLRGIGSKPPA